MSSTLARKISTVWSHVARGRIAELVRVAIRPVVRLHTYRIDTLDITTYQPGRHKAKIPLHCRVATEEDMESLFVNWPDSMQERHRHSRVYHDLGFKTCFLVTHRETGEPVHFQFLITFADRHLVRSALPTKLYRYLTDGSTAYRNWAYTFERFRNLGVAGEVADYVVEYCRRQSIRRLYSHRGMRNRPSVRISERRGDTHIATAYHIQWLRQRHESGMYLVRKIRG